MNIFEDKLEKIIIANDLEELKSLFLYLNKEFCDDVNIYNHHINYSLEEASMYNMTDIVMYILINYKNILYDSAVNYSLRAASIYCRINIIKYILYNYSFIITNDTIDISIVSAKEYSYSSDIVRYLMFYKSFRKYNLSRFKYKNTIILY